jgi:hypothetical protein
MDADLVTEVLRQALETRSPELGATLKQRLNMLLAQRGAGPFDERALGFKKFQDFLGSQDWLEIKKPTGSGDISVFLRTAPPIQVSSTDTQREKPSPSNIAIRSDIWQAFTNPDPKRKRHFHRTNGAVLHFVEGEDSPNSALVNDARDEFIEIQPIDGAMQLRWMRMFLDALPLGGNERSAVDAMLVEPYTSALNVTFTRALGSHAGSWREFRTRRVTDQITAWAAQAGVPIEQLHPPTSSHVAAVPARQPAMSQRERAMKLLELLSDEDIARLVIPVLLSTLLVQSRI